ncbi:MAG: hypothetical protein PHS97_05385, partial [Oscillospiraceae bacterium]|nr:hypothetical protein [Oscillospiraceae bacterium]
LSIFRFRKASLASTFAASVFPEPSGQKASRGRVFTPPPGASTAVLAMTARCVPGTRVCHRQFGAGNIVAREGDLVTILFDSGTQKRFLLTVALQQGFLSMDAGAP